MILTVTEIVSFVKIKVKADVYAPSINISLKTRKFSQEKQKTKICFVCLFTFLQSTLLRAHPIEYCMTLFGISVLNNV